MHARRTLQLLPLKMLHDDTRDTKGGKKFFIHIIATYNRDSHRLIYPFLKLNDDT